MLELVTLHTGEIERDQVEEKLWELLDGNVIRKTDYIQLLKEAKCDEAKAFLGNRELANNLFLEMVKENNIRMVKWLAAEYIYSR